MATTVPMLSPDGTSGEIPQDKVQDALKAGFKQAVAMTSPDGKPGYIPVERQQDAIKAGFKPVGPPQQPEGHWYEGTAPWQKAVDAAAQTTPYSMDKGLVGNAKAALSNLGAGAVGALIEPIAHPIEAVKSLAGGIARPIRPDDPAAFGLDTKTPIGQQLGRAGAQLTAAVPSMALVAADPGIVKGPRSIPAVSRVLNNTAEKMYGTAMKPATTLSAADRTAMVRTGLDNALPVSPAGVDKLGSLIDDLNQKIKDVVDADPNRPIDPNAAATRTDISKQRFTNQVNATKDLNAIESSRQQFLREQGAPVDAQGNLVGPSPSMPANKAQAMKQGTYSVLRDKYGEQGAAAVEAQKNLAMGLKEELAKQFPELSSLNAAESKLLDLGPVLERAVNRVSNNHTIGIGGPLVASAVKASTGSGVAAGAIGFMKSIVDIPAVKSRLAIQLSKAAKIPYPQAAARVAAYSASLESAARAGQVYSTDDTPSQ